MGDTIFGKIIRREIPADIVFENDDVVGFRDLNPQAPVHVLFIPKKPLPTLDDAQPADAELLGKVLLAAADYARQEGLAEQGYRTVINCNEHGGQTVFHLHVHLLAGRRMSWPPG
ncbi:histidine triad nucleotide-binding protein [Frateuria edaphi]|jgi:histidine triad (HIT) family protein|uniref:histidine triad nucleotide-binding protein n=1 Tax=Frateuria TaxID=70411 RepID=UPI001E3F0987|nr:histidine triad nucleotide-binding protein [Frateuria edaphi]UGB47468.1 histidine triad nucleotide-binding protein [Frateuria edaphi]